MVSRRRRVPNRLGNRTFADVPVAGAPVQRLHRPRSDRLQLVLVQIAEQMVIAVPDPAIVQRHEEQVRALQAQ